MADAATIEPEIETIDAVELTDEMATKESSGKILVMVDIESLDTGPRSVVLQAALYGLDTDEDVILESSFRLFLPIQPQLDLIIPRTISAATLWWWMQQSDEARAKFEYSTFDDFNALPALMQSMTREFKRMVGDKDYEVWAKGPQFDIVNLESLYKDCGMTPPWRYSKVRDLRTVMAEAGIDADKVEKPKGFIAHDASWDARYQLTLYREARKHLRATR